MVANKEKTKVRKDDQADTYPIARKSHFLAKTSPYLFQLAADFIAITISYCLQFYIRYSKSAIVPDIEMFFSGAILTLFYWHIIFWIAGLYKNWYIRSPFEEFFTIIKTSFFGSVLIFFFIYLDSLMVEGTKSPRFMFLVFFGIISISTTILRFISKKAQVSLRSRGIIATPSIIIGTKDKTIELAEKIAKTPSWGFRTIGIVIVGDYDYSIDPKKIGFRLLGFTSELPQILDIYKPMEALISVKTQDHEQLMKIVSTCGDKNIAVKIEPDLYDIFTGQVRTLPIYGIPLIEISSQLLKPWEAAVKRLFDIVFSLLVIILGLPFWLLFALIIKLESKGPVFYTQKRTGKNGNEFRIYKFRSMFTNIPKEAGWTVVNDPRVTKFGKFIRKSHLDEIPQFWNVLIGDMSVVGPRPEQPKFVEEFSNEISYYKRRLKVRPGITGWWQIQYQPYELSLEEIKNRLKDDFYYIENMSLKLDIEIVVRTVYCVIKGHGQT